MLSDRAPFHEVGTANALLNTYGLSQGQLQNIALLGQRSRASAGNLVEGLRRWLVDKPWRAPFLTRRVGDERCYAEADYWQRFLTGRVDEQYVADRLAMGAACVQNGLPPSAYTAMMAFAQRWLFAATVAEEDLDTQATFEAISALCQLDVALVMNAYAEHSRRLVSVEHELLEQSNHELSNFAHSAAHDLRAPLRGIRNLLGQFFDGDGEPEEREQCRMLILRSAERMATMIEDMLDFASVDRRPTPMLELDLEAVLADVLLDLEAMVSESQARVTHGQLPCVTGIPSQIRRLLQNTLANAIKYRRPGVIPEIHIDCTLPDGFVEITVQDNGIGFDVAKVEQVFRPFQRLVGGAEYSGSGIGMATARRIVQQHGGSIDATSVLGQGSCFIIRLPLTPAELSQFRDRLRSPKGAAA